MQDLIKQEQFEIETLDRLNSGKFLGPLIFTGGTMLRLCYGLNRYSVDLDFWLYKEIDIEKYFIKLKKFLENYYQISDAENKLNTLLIQIKSTDYPRSLKIEIRKKIEKVKIENSIAYSKYSNIQVYVRTLSLKNLMETKVKAFLSRREIRDVFDIEFLLKKGVEIKATKDELKALLEGIHSLRKTDYTTKLGSILDPEIRKYYVKENFKILKFKVKEFLENE